MTQDSDARAGARVGTTLRGKYRIDRVLGVGGMAVVYAATHRNTKRFAVKMLHPELSIREDIRTRFLREGYAANSLDHPGAVAVMDDDVAEDGAAFLVMELLDGAEVQDLWERASPVPIPASLAVIDQLLDVLAAAHAKGIVHRDIKPANLFVTRDGTLKVLDFGIARLLDTGGHATHTGMVLGTPAFMAPEQALGASSQIDGQTDVWAAGATLFTLLSGRPVHEGETAQSLMIKAATEAPRSLGSVMPAVPAPVVSVVDRAIAFKKADRWLTAKDMRDALREAHATLYGGEPGKLPLAKLFEASERATGGRSVPSAAPAVASDPTEAAPRVADAITAQPVTRDKSLASPPGQPVRKRSPVVAIGAVGAVCLGLAAYAGYALRPRAVTAAAAPAASGVLPSAPSALSTPSATLTPRDAPIDPHAAATATSEAPSASARPDVPAALVRPSGHPTGATTHSAPSPSPSPPAPAAAKPNCNPPYVIDAEGHRKYKTECL